MTARLRIVVADDELDMRIYFERMLPRLGHDVVAAASNGRELIDACLALQPDLVITDIKMPIMDGIKAARELYKRQPVPVILVSAYHDEGLIERAENDHVLAYLVKPIKQVHLAPAIAIATRRFEQFETLKREVEDLRYAFADCKLIERAKQVLMRREALDEHGAFERLREIAREQAAKLADVARKLADGATTNPG